MKVPIALLFAITTLTGVIQAAPALSDGLQRVLQGASPAEAIVDKWRNGDGVDIEKHKKKKKTKTETTTKYKTTKVTKPIIITTTICPTSVVPTSKHKSGTITITPTATSTNTKISFPPVLPRPGSSSSSGKKSHSASPTTSLPFVTYPTTTTKVTTHKPKTTTISPSPTSTNTKIHLPPVIPPGKRSSSSLSTTSVSGIVPTATQSASSIVRSSKLAKPTNKPVTSKRVRKALKKAGIIPSVIGDFKPSFLIGATFASEEEHEYGELQSPFLGRKLPTKPLQYFPEIELYAPEVDFDFAAKSSYPSNNLIIALTDPDAPSHSNPKWSEMCHWIAQGLYVRPDTDQVGAVNAYPRDLVQIVPYKAPAPPKHTGKHRYVLLAFMPKNATTEPLHLTVPKERQHWGYKTPGHGVKEWAEENGLLQIAGDFFTAKH